jgi:hypothetical protein
MMKKKKKKKKEQNLLEKQILPKLEDFCILAAILDSKWPQ